MKALTPSTSSLVNLSLLVDCFVSISFGVSLYTQILLLNSCYNALQFCFLPLLCNMHISYTVDQSHGWVCDMCVCLFSSCVFSSTNQCVVGFPSHLLSCCLFCGEPETARGLCVFNLKLPQPLCVAMHRTCFFFCCHLLFTPSSCSSLVSIVSCWVLCSWWVSVCFGSVDVSCFGCVVVDDVVGTMDSIRFFSSPSISLIYSFHLFSCLSIFSSLPFHCSHLLQRLFLCLFHRLYSHPICSPFFPPLATFSCLVCSLLIFILVFLVFHVLTTTLDDLQSVDT